MNRRESRAKRRSGRCRPGAARRALHPRMLAADRAAHAVRHRRTRSSATTAAGALKGFDRLYPATPQPLH
jgi:hypothetical protein